MKRSSKVISWVFLPLFTPLFGLTIALFIPSLQSSLDYLNTDCLYAEGTVLKWRLMYRYAFFTTLIPTIGFTFLMSIGKVTTVEIDNRRERMLPVMIMLGSCTVLYLSFLTIPKEYDIPKYVFSYALSGVVVSLVLLIQTLRIKVSMHAAGVGIMTGFLMAYASNMVAYQFWTIVVPVIISGLVMMARIYLNKHTLSQTLLGWVTGCFVTFAINYIY